MYEAFPVYNTSFLYGEGTERMEPEKRKPIATADTPTLIMNLVSTELSGISL
jgi:hypothetical protein